MNFGRGCVVISSQPAGDDLIVTFAGAGHGITEGNFAAKLLGRTRQGKLLFGYARLPWLNYLEPILSASLPTLADPAEGRTFHVEVQNFGQVASTSAPLKILVGPDDPTTEIASGSVSALGPFEKTVLRLVGNKSIAAEELDNLAVVIEPPGQAPVILHSSSSR